MLHTMLSGIRPAGFGEEDCLSVFTIYGHGGHLCHVTSIMSSDFISLYLKAFIKNFAQIDTVGSEQIRFEFFVCTQPWANVKK